MRYDDPAFRRFILSAVPSMVGWRSAFRTWINLLVFGLIVLAGTWTVHQFEYAIVYGDRFGAVMATTPHRFYMGPLGVCLALGTMLWGIAALWSLAVGRVRLQRVRRRLPNRYARRLATPVLAIPYRSVGRTAVLLFALQTGLYLLQENLETFAVAGSWPGVAVLIAPQHWTVLPLHSLIASCGSLLLWMISVWLHRTRETGHMAEILAALWAGPPPRNTRQNAPQSYVPVRHLRAGARGLRAPPMPARNLNAFLASR